jgi:hypothetical protein
MQPCIPKHVPPLVLLWVIVFALTLPMNPPSFAALLLRIRKAESTATITREADPKNHLYVTYEYVVDGRTYSAVGYTPNRREMRLGEHVRVCYFPDRPQAATIATDREQTGYLKGGVVSGIFMATCMTFAVYWRYFRARKKSTPQTAS